MTTSNKTVEGEKECRKCGKVKPLKKYYSHPATKDRHLGMCIKCKLKYFRKRYAENRENELEYSRKYSKTERGKKAKINNNRKMYKKYPEKYKARAMFHYYLKTGKIKKEDCEFCGKKAQAHHDDYSKPLDVRWLCPYHHRKVEGRLAEYYQI